MKQKILRRTILLLMDAFLIFFAGYFSFLYHYEISFISDQPYWIYIFGIIIGIPIYIFTGQYSAITRYLGSQSLYKIILRNTLIVFILIFIEKIFNPESFKLNYWIFYLFLLSFLISGIRFIARDIINYIYKHRRSKIYSSNILIYGAGELGSRVSKFIENDKKLNLIGFIDDNKHLQNRYLNEFKIYNPSVIKNNKLGVSKILICFSNVKKENLKIIVEEIRQNNIEVFRSPSIEDLKDMPITQPKLNPISILDLLGREPVKAQEDLMKKCIKDKVILVTGAGGSIGGEICKQIINLKASKLLIADHSEISLYKINKTISDISKIKVIPILTDLSEREFLKKILKEHKVSIIFHCAAYKHVPLLESNILNGLKNNIFSTLELCKAAAEASVENFMLISSDKAVRPTNIMGASKRICEIIVKDFSEQKNKTLFSMVRFGNVIGSSGSVIPLFEEQIRKGGPVTLTDSRMTRYFMSINEAAQLVIQSTELSNGGDLFLLEMGEPVKILDLVNQMIKLSGLKVKSKNNLNGDIKIKEIGLRSGEKLYEELLVDGEARKTIHPRIYRAFDKFIINKNLFEDLSELKNSITNNNHNDCIKIVKKLVPEYIKID